MSRRRWINLSRLWICISCFLVIQILLLTGCGNTTQPDSGVSKSSSASIQEDTPYFQIMEYEIPDADEALTAEGILQNENWWIQEVGLTFQEGILFRCVNLEESMADGSGVWFTRGICLQTLEYPYEKWQNTLISPDGFGDVQVSCKAFRVCENGRILMTLNALELQEDHLVCYEQNQTLRELLRIPEKAAMDSWVLTGDNQLYAISSLGNEVYAYDEQGQEQETYVFPGIVKGCIWNEAGQNTWWYGYGTKGICFWEIPGGKLIYPEMEGVDRYGFQVTYSKDGTLLLGDMEKLYQVGPEGAEELFAFGEKDFPLDELYGVSWLENGGLGIYASLGGEEVLLHAEEKDRASLRQKQEISLALLMPDRQMEKLVAQYNRRNEWVHVTIESLASGQNKEDYRNRIQMEISAGKGPDLLSGWVIDAEDYAENGYLYDLGDLIKDPEAFLSATLEGGKFGGVTYGIPYTCIAYLGVFPKEITGDRLSWTPEEMMDAVEASGVEILMSQMTEMDILYLCGLVDVGNRDYIDWENRVSHLEGESFQRLVRFAKKYADHGQYAHDEIGERKQNGQIAGENLAIYSPGSMDYMASCFGEKQVVPIGFPRKDGCPGIYMQTTYLYMNKGSEKREAVEDFLQYLLSEKAQDQYGEGDEHRQYLSVRCSAVRQGISRYNRMTEEPQKCSKSSGEYWLEDGLDEEQEECYLNILEQAQPENSPAYEIWSIVSEELQPYFDEKRSLEQCVEILDNRVQLYLEEK